MLKTSDVALHTKRSAWRVCLFVCFFSRENVCNAGHLARWFFLHYKFPLERCVFLTERRRRVFCGGRVRRAGVGFLHGQFSIERATGGHFLIHCARLQDAAAGIPRGVVEFHTVRGASLISAQLCSIWRNDERFIGALCVFGFCFFVSFFFLSRGFSDEASLVQRSSGIWIATWRTLWTRRGHPGGCKKTEQSLLSDGERVLFFLCASFYNAEESALRNVWLMVRTFWKCVCGRPLFCFFAAHYIHW